MEIGILVENIYNYIHGFEPTTDSAVKRVDIRAKLPAAINYAIDKAYNINIQTEGDRDMPSEFYGVYEEVEINRDRPIPYILMEKGVVPLKGNAGIRLVYDDRGNQYSPLSDADMGSIKYYQDKSCMRFFRRNGKKRLDLYGVGPEEEYLHYQAITSIDDLSDEDEAPIQAGMEVDVFAYMRDWFVGGVPADNLANSKDDIKTIG